MLALFSRASSLDRQPKKLGPTSKAELCQKCSRNLCAKLIVRGISTMGNVVRARSYGEIRLRRITEVFPTHERGTSIRAQRNLIADVAAAAAQVGGIKQRLSARLKYGEKSGHGHIRIRCGLECVRSQR